MAGHAMAPRELAKGTGRLVIHLVAVVVGLALMIAGIGMGVSIVMLPVGVPVGFVGLLAFLWGLFGWFRRDEAPSQPPGPQ